MNGLYALGDIHLLVLILAATLGGIVVGGTTIVQGSALISDTEIRVSGEFLGLQTGFIQGGFNASTTETFNRQAEHIAYIINEALTRGATSVEPSEEAQSEWVRHIRETATDISQLQRECEAQSRVDGAGAQPAAQAGVRRQCRPID